MTGQQHRHLSLPAWERLASYLERHVSPSTAAPLLHLVVRCEVCATLLETRPLALAGKLADIAIRRKSLAVGYTLTMFVAIPLAGILILR